jgi:hypothetical protein
MFTTLGVSRLPDRLYRKLNQQTKFIYTAYNFPALVAVSEKLAREALAQAGGRMEKDAAGEDIFVIPVRAPRPSKFEDLRKPGPIAGSRYSDDEMRKIRTPGLNWALPKLLPGWELSGADLRQSAMHWEHRGKQQVLVLATAGKSKSGWKLARKLEVSTGATPRLCLAAGCDPKSAGWDLTIKAQDKVLLMKTVTPSAAIDGWLGVDLPIPAEAGKSIVLEIAGKPKAGARPEAAIAYLADVRVKVKR